MGCPLARRRRFTAAEPWCDDSGGQRKRGDCALMEYAPVDGLD
jgi:hypothetical protein